jgi:hypothetical protein
MKERKTYVNADELQADDELSPLPLKEGQGDGRKPGDKPRQEVQNPPPAATSE